MKYFVKYFVITLAIFICTYTEVKSSEIAYIDLKIVLNESKAGKEAQDFLKKSHEKNIDKFKKAEISLKEKERDLISKKDILSKEEYKKMADKLRQDTQDYVKERDIAFKKITKQRAEARTKLIEVVKPILENYSKEKNISIFLNKRDVLYADPELELTNIIINLLNKKLPSINLN